MLLHLHLEAHVVFRLQLLLAESELLKLYVVLGLHLLDLVREGLALGLQGLYGLLESAQVALQVFHLVLALALVLAVAVLYLLQLLGKTVALVLYGYLEPLGDLGLHLAEAVALGLDGVAGLGEAELVVGLLVLFLGLKCADDALQAADGVLIAVQVLVAALHGLGEFPELLVEQGDLHLVIVDFLVFLQYLLVYLKIFQLQGALALLGIFLPAVLGPLEHGLLLLHLVF